jgi:hypothetical protein
VPGVRMMFLHDKQAARRCGRAAQAAGRRDGRLEVRIGEHVAFVNLGLALKLIKLKDACWSARTTASCRRAAPSLR